MLRVAHIVNPFGARSGSLPRDQRIALAAMKRARDVAAPLVDVELLSTQYEEDAAAIPPFVRKTANLEASVRDVKGLERGRKLPLIGEILDNAYATSDADYLIYTNVDICPFPWFYADVARLLGGGYDGLAINRLDAPLSLDDLPGDEDRALDTLFVAATLEHIGIDCVVFRRELFPRMEFRGVCTGVPPVGQALLDNVEAHSRRFVWGKHGRFTCHIGRDNGTWIRDKDAEQALRRYNNAEYAQIGLFTHGPFTRHGPPLTRILSSIGRLPMPPALRRRLQTLRRRLRDLRRW